MNANPDSRRAYFESMYGADDDPYGVGERWYEQRKRAVLLSSLPRMSFARAYEPGCGTGALTAELAKRCESVLASDWSLKALTTARHNTSHLKNVTIEQHELPQDWPKEHGLFDLIVLSELGYFLDATRMDEVAQHCTLSLSKAGVLVACDWKPDFAERALSTRRVHAALSAIDLTQLVVHQEADFVLRIWSRDSRSVAQHEEIR